jgi:hypothetical protein
MPVNTIGLSCEESQRGVFTVDGFDGHLKKKSNRELLPLKSPKQKISDWVYPRVPLNIGQERLEGLPIDGFQLALEG